MKAKATRSIFAGCILLFLSLPFLARASSSDHRTHGLTPLFPTEQQSVINEMPGVTDQFFYKENGSAPQKHQNDCYPKKHNRYTKTELFGKRE